MPVILEGVLRNDGADSASVRRAMASALAREGRIAYRVTPSPMGGDKRASERRQSRLRSAKLLDLNNRFLCECLVRDRSSTGLRLTLMKNVALPNRCRVFDDETGEVRTVMIAWRRESAIGMRYCANEGSAAISRNVRAALRGRYYAMLD